MLLVRAAEAREVLPQELSRRGARIDVVPAYRTVRSREAAEEVRGLLRDRRIHIVTFASSSTVKHFFALLGPEAKDLLNGVTIAAIGPITAASAAQLGIPCHIVPDQYTIPALVAALVKHFAPRPGSP
jgi:uroporphyrinogen III methyltransferase / synthase